jgi:RNA polymerase sigma-70 factor (ECF subfamily)
MNNVIIIIQQRIAAGEEPALAELYHLLYKKLLHFAHSLVKNKEAAEEITEDVFVKLWCSRTQILSIENLTVYLYVAVKNRSLNFLSSKIQSLTIAPFDYIDVDIAETNSSPENILISQQMMQQMQGAVEALPPRCKMVYKLIREDGLKYKEVSEILNISINTIDAQMAIAVKRICNALQIEKRPSKK